MTSTSYSTYIYNLKRIPYLTKNKKIVSLITTIFSKHNNNYGLPRITLELKNHYHLNINKKKVYHIMKLLHLRVNYPKGRYNSYRPNFGQIFPNILNRNFTSPLPYQKITTDVTEFKFPWGKCYLQCFLDLYNQEILTYQISTNTELINTIKPLKQLIKQYPLTNTIIHSDRGWQYQHPAYQQILKDNHLIQSMSNKATCHDNAIIENLFGKIKIEMFYHHEFTYKDYSQFKLALTKYIHYYNTSRIKVNLGYSPINYRLKYAN